tara:strand:+ start:243 stop:452 length:210 start_codon:yes stop_codon:yes gene_type:complete
MGFGNEAKDYPAKSSGKVGFDMCHYSKAESFIKSPYCFEIFVDGERVHLYEIDYQDGERLWQGRVGICA